jgi:hypothetical protein
MFDVARATTPAAFATLAAMRRASSLLSNLAADRPGRLETTVPAARANVVELASIEPWYERAIKGTEQ